MPKSLAPIPALNAEMSSVVARIAALVSRALAEGFLPRYSIAAPDTWGEASEVPEVVIVMLSSLPSGVPIPMPLATRSG